MNKATFDGLFWAVAGAGLGIGLLYFLGYLVGLYLEYKEAQELVDQLKARPPHFKQVTITPRMTLWAYSHGIDLKDVLDVGEDEEMGTQYFFMHGQTDTGACKCGLVRCEEDGNLYLLDHESNQVAETVMAIAATQVHTDWVVDLARKLAIRLARSDSGRVWGIYYSTGTSQQTQEQERGE